MLTDLPADLIGLQASLEETGLRPRLLEMVRAVTADVESCAALKELKRQLGQQHKELEGSDRFERLVLFLAAREMAPELESAPLDEAVKQLWLEEVKWLAQPHTATHQLHLETQPFEAAALIVTLRRFPAGPMDWELSGVPVSWLLKTGRHAPGLLRFLMREVQGREPLMFLHMARKPRSRGLILENETMRMYHRMARTLKLQDEVRGIMTAGWFNDPAAVKDSPHLSWVNRPFREFGGFAAPMGLADEGSGLTEGNQKRKERLDAGELRYRIWVVLWPREKAIAWAEQNPQWQG